MPDPTPAPEPEPEPVPAVVDVVVTEEGDETGNDISDVESEYRAFAIENGYTWEDFVEQVLPANSLDNFLAMGGTIKILEARLRNLK